MAKPSKRTWEIWEIILLVVVVFYIGYQFGRSSSGYEFGHNLGSGIRNLGK